MRIFIGYDKKQDIAYRVLVKSIRKHNKELPIIPLVKSQLIETGDYYRVDKPDESTDFTYTRFLVPYLSGYEGVSLFLDSDMVVTTDIANILEYFNYDTTVMCVQHDDYLVTSSIKMDGRVQEAYPRKNWSSVMLFNNSKCRILRPDTVSEATPAYLHRMYWAEDAIGKIPKTWNHLVGYYPKKKLKLPKIVHYTDGGPWISEKYADCDYADLWYSIRETL